MAEVDSPAIARRRVRLAIREARESAALTQHQVAEAMEWSASKVIRIESGHVTISGRDLRQLLHCLGIRDKVLIKKLTTDARVARAKAWWPESRSYSQLPDGHSRYIEYEVEPSKIRSLPSRYLPVPPQTQEHRAVLNGGWLGKDDTMPLSKITAHVEKRRIRRDAVLGRDDSVKLLVNMDESVLTPAVGCNAAFIAQLRRLTEMRDRGLVELRVIPFDLDTPIADNGSFDLMTVGADGEVLYRENGISDEIVENRAGTTRHRKRFEQLWQAADDEIDTIDFIKGRITDLEKKLPGSLELTSSTLVLISAGRGP